MCVYMWKWALIKSLRSITNQMLFVLWVNSGNLMGHFCHCLNHNCRSRRMVAAHFWHDSRSHFVATDLILIPTMGYAVLILYPAGLRCFCWFPTLKGQEPYTMVLSDQLRCMLCSLESTLALFFTHWNSLELAIDECDYLTNFELWPDKYTVYKHFDGFLV